MRRTTGIGMAVGALLALLSTSAASAQGQQTLLWTQLTGSTEVPGPGDPTGSGAALVIFERDDGAGQYNVCWAVAEAGLQNVVASHIHPGPAGVANDPIIPFSAPTPTSSGCVTAPMALGDDIIANPDQYYVNVHTRALPGGAIRGQLMSASMMMGDMGAM